MRKFLAILTGLSVLTFANSSRADEYTCFVEAELAEGGTETIGSMTPNPDKVRGEQVAIDADGSAFVTCGGSGEFTTPSPVDSAVMCAFVFRDQKINWRAGGRGLPQGFITGAKGEEIPHPSTISIVVGKGSPAFSLRVAYPGHGNLNVSCNLKKKDEAPKNP